MRLIVAFALGVIVGVAVTENKVTVVPCPKGIVLTSAHGASRPF